MSLLEGNVYKIFSYWCVLIGKGGSGETMSLWGNLKFETIEDTLNCIVWTEELGTRS